MYLSQPSWDFHPSGILHTCSASLTKGSSRSGAVSQRQHGNGYEQPLSHDGAPGPARPGPAQISSPYPQAATRSIPDWSAPFLAPAGSRAIGCGPQQVQADVAARVVRSRGMWAPVCRIRSPVVQSAHNSGCRLLGTGPRCPSTCCISVGGPLARRSPAAQWRSSRPGSSLVVRLVAARPVVRLVARPAYHRSSPAAAEPLHQTPGPLRVPADSTIVPEETVDRPGPRLSGWCILSHTVAAP